MTYKSVGREDDDNLYKADFDLVSEALASFVRSGQPGIATLFVYNVYEEQGAFCQFAKRLAKERGLGCRLCWITHRGGNRNMVALLYAKLPPGFVEDAVEGIEDMALDGHEEVRATRPLTIETERELDGRWIAEVPELGGAMAYGSTRDEAIARVKALALRVLAENIEEDERPAETIEIWLAAG